MSKKLTFYETIVNINWAMFGAVTSFEFSETPN